MAKRKMLIYQGCCENSDYACPSDNIYVYTEENSGIRRHHAKLETAILEKFTRAAKHRSAHSIYHI